MNDKDLLIEGSEASLLSLIQLADERNSTVPYEGFIKEDLNISGNLLLVHSAGSIYSFPRKSIIASEPLGQGRARLWVRAGTKAFFSRGFSVGSNEPFSVGMEDTVPPEPTFDPNAPTQADVSIFEAQPFAATLAGVISAWSNKCEGGDSYENNCAHFLSDAFIRAGFSELAGSNSHINARCNTSARRPIRARDMWSWFQSKAVRTSRNIQRNTGNWAIFQLKESVYWGGHVVVLDSNAWSYAGTGWYGEWDQYLYQW